MITHRYQPVQSLYSQGIQAFFAPHTLTEDNKMNANRPIASFFARLTVITILLFLGDAIDILTLAKHAIRASAQTVVDSTTEPTPMSSHPTRMAEGG
jgi:hypothetical protein